MNEIKAVGGIKMEQFAKLKKNISVILSNVRMSIIKKIISKLIIAYKSRSKDIWKQRWRGNEKQQVTQQNARNVMHWQVPLDTEMQTISREYNLCDAVFSLLCVISTKSQQGWLYLSVRLSAWLNSRTAGRIWMNFRMDIMPLGCTLKS
jgi:hypothetical protein